MYDTIVIFCNDHEWVIVERKKVTIQLDLQHDIVHYVSKCPVCKKRIVMSRRMPG